MYGIVERKRWNGSYVATVPTEEPQKYISKQFAKSRYENAKQAAIEWRDEKGVEIWGERRWSAIVSKRLTARRFWGKNFGVYVYREFLQHEWEVWRVEWRNPKTKKNECRIFSPRNYGDLTNAEICANIFAAQKRAEISLSEIVQPTHLIF